VLTPNSKLQLSANSWQFSVNIIKTSILNLCNTIYFTTVTSYSVDEAILSHYSVISDLGILTDNRLLFRDHINILLLSHLNALMQYFAALQVVILLLCARLSSPMSCQVLTVSGTHLNKHLIDAIENIQRRYTKRMPNLPSPERLAAFSLDTLELRRLRVDLITYYKFLNSLTPLTWDYLL
jgi:hypothetical protein